MIELPAHDSIYEYLLDTVFPSNIRKSPFYPLLKSFGTFLSEQDLGIYNKTLNDYNEENIVNGLREARYIIRIGRQIYDMIKEMETYDELYPKEMKDEFEKSYVYNEYRNYRNKLEYIIEKYNQSFDVHKWYISLIKQYKYAADIVSGKDKTIKNQYLYYIFTELIFNTTIPCKCPRVSINTIRRSTAEQLNYIKNYINVIYPKLSKT